MRLSLANSRFWVRLTRQILRKSWPRHPCRNTTWTKMLESRESSQIRSHHSTDSRWMNRSREVWSAVRTLGKILCRDLSRSCTTRGPEMMAQRTQSSSLLPSHFLGHFWGGMMRRLRIGWYKHSCLKSSKEGINTWVRATWSEDLGFSWNKPSIDWESWRTRSTQSISIRSSANSSRTQSRWKHIALKWNTWRHNRADTRTSTPRIRRPVAEKPSTTLKLKSTWTKWITPSRNLALFRQCR